LNFIEGKKEPREGPKQELNRNRQADVLVAASDESSHVCILVKSSKSYHQFRDDSPFDPASLASLLHRNLQWGRQSRLKGWRLV